MKTVLIKLSGLSKISDFIFPKIVFNRNNCLLLSTSNISSNEIPSYMVIFHYKSARLHFLSQQWKRLINIVATEIRNAALETFRIPSSTVDVITGALFLIIKPSLKKKKSRKKYKKIKNKPEDVLCDDPGILLQLKHLLQINTSWVSFLMKTERKCTRNL